MTRPKTLKEARLSFCGEARRWATRFKTLNQAWAACDNGCWMAWWLYRYRRRDLRSELMTFARVAHIDEFPFTGIYATSEQKKAFADLLRKNFYPSGRRRNA